MVFFVLEAHGALHFRCGVNELAQRISGQGMIVTAGVHVLEFAGLVIAALSVHSLKQKSLNLIGCIQRVAVLFMELIGIKLEDAADIGSIRCAVLVDDIPKDQSLARTKDVCRSPVE